MFFIMISAFVSLVFFLTHSRFKLNFSLTTIICSLLCAAGFICAFAGLNRALQIGPLSLSTLIYTFSLFVPVIYGIIVLQESISKLFIIGMPLLIISIILVNYVKEDCAKEKNKLNIKWLMWVLTAFLGNGLFSTVQKVHQFAMKGEYGNELMILSLSISCVSLAIFGLLLEKEKFSKSFKYSYWAAFHGLLNGANNQCLLVLATKASSSLVYPFVTGGTLVFTSLISYIFFKEKLLIKQWLGVGAGIVAVILISIR